MQQYNRSSDKILLAVNVSLIFNYTVNVFISFFPTCDSSNESFFDMNYPLFCLLYQVVIVYILCVPVCCSFTYLPRTNHVTLRLICSQSFLQDQMSSKRSYRKSWTGHLESSRSAVVNIIENLPTRVEGDLFRIESQIGLILKCRCMQLLIFETDLCCQWKI